MKISASIYSNNDRSLGNLIKDLEKKLKNLEIKLNNATKTQNISELTEFGQQYTLIEKQLSDELEKWVNF